MRRGARRACVTHVGHREWPPQGTATNLVNGRESSEEKTSECPSKRRCSWASRIQRISRISRIVPGAVTLSVRLDLFARFVGLQFRFAMPNEQRLFNFQLSNARFSIEAERAVSLAIARAHPCSARYRTRMISHLAEARYA